MEQRSPDWYAARLGKVTASRIACVMARTRTGYSATRDSYMAELICERLTGVPAENYVSAAMQHGIDTEDAAKAAYCFEHGSIEDCGFFDHPSIHMSGASPDGLIGDDGLVEIKCPSLSTHLATLLDETIDGKYHLQMQFQLATTGRTWCDFVSFDPRWQPSAQLWVKRVHRDNAKIAEIEAEVRKFLAELDAKVAALQAKFLREAA